MDIRPKFSIGFLALGILFISMLSFLACDTAVGRAIGGDRDGGAIQMPSPPVFGEVYLATGELDTPAPDEDEWTFEAKEETRVEIHLRTAPGSITSVDTYLILLGPNGQRIAENDDFEGNHAGIVTVLPDSGQYTIVAKGYGLSFGSYELAIALEGEHEDLDGGPISESDATGLSLTLGEIQIGPDEDVWEIPTLAGDTMLIVLDGVTSLDPTLELLDPNGERVDFSDDFVGRDSQILHVAQMDGVYLAVARGYGGTSTGEYYLTVSGNAERGILNGITENLQRVEAELAAAGELSAAAVAAELAEAAQLAEREAERELQQAQNAAALVETAARNSAEADIRLIAAEVARVEAEVRLDEVTDRSRQLDEMIVRDIDELEKANVDADAADKITMSADEKVLNLENELERLKASETDAIRIAAAVEERLEAMQERQTAQSRADAARLEEADALVRLARNAEASALAEIDAQTARAEVAELAAASARAELAALSARMVEESATQNLVEESQEAATAAAIAESAVAAAQDGAAASSLTTVIEGGYVGVSAPEYGTASVVDGEVYYTHDGSSNAVDSFTATVRGDDGELVPLRLWVTLTYLRPNSAPIAVDDQFSLLSGEATIGLDLTANDTDIDGHNLAITHINGAVVESGDIVSIGENFSLTVCGTAICPEAPNGVILSSSHAGNYSGQSAFTYTVSDGNGLSSVGTVTVQHTTDYLPPTALEQNIQSQQGSSSDYVLTGIPDGTSIQLVTQGNVGTVAISGPDTITYTHSGQRLTSDSFQYTIVDEYGIADWNTVNVAVEITNSSPTPQNVSALVLEGGTVRIGIEVSGFTPEQLDPESDVLRPPLLSSSFYSDPNAIQPSNGAYIFESEPYDGSEGQIGYYLVYTHHGSETTEDFFNYELVQEDGGTGWGTVTITVDPINDIPLASDYSLTVDQGGSINLDVVNDLTDPDGPVMIVEIATPPTEGSVTLDGSRLTYTHNGNSLDADYFQYTLDDGIDHSVSATVIVNISQTSLDLAAVGLPAAGKTKVAWDPEIGIRISSPDNLQVRNLGAAFTLFECADSLCDDSQLTQVSGSTAQLQEPSSQILSFIPDVPLYGGTTYKVSVNSNSGIELAGGNMQNLSGLIEDITSWTFTTAEMTRFTLPLLITYNDSECIGAQEPKLASRIGENLCMTLEDIDALLYGMEENALAHYFDVLSSGKFVISPIRNRAGHVVKSVQIDRNKPYIGGNCGRGWETAGVKAFDGCPDYEPDTTLREEMDLILDRFRYRNLTHKDGSYNLLAPYLPTREGTISMFGIGSEQDRLGNGQHYFRNITPIYIYGVGGPDSSPWSVIGMATQPRKSYQPSASMSHEESHRTWGHELGHAYFALPDYYQTGHPAGPNKTGPLDLMGDREGSAVGKGEWPPFTAWNIIKSEFHESQELFSDGDLLAYLAGSGSAPGLNNNAGTLYNRTNYSDFNIIKVPAIIERDTQEVKGHYLLELYGSTGYDSQISVNSDTVAFSDSPGAFPGGIAIWKWDKTEQKIRTDVCQQYFGGGVPNCGAEFLFQNGSHPDPIEYYPSIPSVTRGNDSGWPGTPSGINTLFPWWYSAQLPYGANYESELTNMPTTIELPVLEIAPFDEDPNFGGGNRVATVTISFDQFVDELKTRVRQDSQGADSGNLNGYTLQDSAPFTYAVEKHDTPTHMTYKDHVREGQLPFALQGGMWDEMQAYGYYRFQEVPDQ